MPEAGDVKREKGTSHSWYYIWVLCESCGKGRWIQRGNEDRSKRCRECYQKERPHPSGSECPNWKGGRYNHKGYIMITLDRKSPFYPMVNQSGTILEHRLVMAKHLNRCLLKTEQVHHIDGNPSNNSVENLELISPANHTLYKKMCDKCPLRFQIRQLKAEMDIMKKRLI